MGAAGVRVFDTLGDGPILHTTGYEGQAGCRDSCTADSRASCGATGLILFWQGGDEELGALDGIAVFGAVAEEFAGGGG